MKNIAVILAGGSGSRLGGEVPKQFLTVKGKTIIEYTLDRYNSHPEIDEIVIVCKDTYIQYVEQLVKTCAFCKVSKIIAGGTERYQSSLAAIDGIDGNEDVNILFHDAVRPLVCHRVISDCITALSKYNAVNVALKTTDTIIQVNQNHCIVSIPPRSTLMNGQCPQGFKLDTIKKAYYIGLQDPHFSTTDDCGVVLKYIPDEPIFVVDGDVQNFKITYPEDITLLEQILSQQ